MPFIKCNDPIKAWRGSVWVFAILVASHPGVSFGESKEVCYANNQAFSSKGEAGGSLCAAMQPHVQENSESYRCNNGPGPSDSWFSITKAGCRKIHLQTVGDTEQWSLQSLKHYVHVNACAGDVDELQVDLSTAISCVKIDEPPSDCENKTGQPVIVANGGKYYRFQDVAGFGAFPLTFDRYYRVYPGKISGNEKTVANWSWGYADKKLVVTSSGNITVVRGDATGKLHFSLNGSVWESQDDGTYNELEPVYDAGSVQTGWLVHLGNGASEEYNMDGYLMHAVSREGLSHSVQYTINEDLISVMDMMDDQSQRTLRVYFDDDNNMPVKVVELDSPSQAETGRSFTEYVWNDDATLHAVLRADGSVQMFEYDSNSNSGIKGLITGIFELSATEYSTLDPGDYPSGSQRYSKVVYDSRGRVTSSALWDGSQKTQGLTFSYDWTWSSNTTSPSTTITNAAGLATTYTFSTSAPVNSSTSIMRWKLVSVDGAGDSVSGCAATSANTGYENGYIKTTTDNTGNVVTKRTRDSQGRITVLQTGLDNTQSPVFSSLKTEIVYAGFTSLPASKTYFGHTGGNWAAYRSEVFGYDSHNRLDSRTETDLLSSGSRVWNYATTYHSGTAVPSSMVITDPRSNVTIYSYNSSGQLTSIVLPTVGGVTQTTSYADYNGFGLPETVTDPNGTVTTLTYDVRGRLTGSSTDGAATTVSYWPNGLVKRVTRPDGTWLAYSYNSAHQLTGIENQSGESIALTPSVLNGQWTTASISDGNNTVTAYHRAFDALGRLWKAQDASGTDKTVFNYDANDNLRAIIALGDVGNNPTYDDASRVTLRTYDGQNRVTSESRCTDSAAPTPPYSCASALAVTSYSYDDQGNINTVTDPNGHVTSYTYNGFGELASQVSPDTGTTMYTYDAVGNLATKTKGYGTGDAQTISYTWDALNRLSGIDYPGTDQDVSYTYDQGTHGKGHLTQVADGSGTTDYTYNTLGQVTSKTETTGSLVQVTSYQYNSAGQLTGITYPDGQQVASTYSNGQLNSLLDASFSATLASNITHQPFAGLNGWDVPTTVQGVHVARQYDTNGRLNAFGLVSADQTSSWSRTLDYDAYGNISASRLTGDDTQDEVYQYDALNRLTQVTAPYGRLSYSYDANGNRTQTVNEQRDPTTQAWQEKYTETYAIDSASNRLNSVTRTKGGTGTTPLRTRSFAYDGRGNTKTDTRQRGSSSPLIYPLHYGNSDRLNSIATP